MTTEAIIYFSMLGAAVAGYAAILLSIPFRRKRVLLRAGALRMKLDVASSKKWVAIAVVAAVLLLVVPLRNFGLLVSAIMLGCALLASEIAAREAAGCGHAGIYENMLVSGTSAILWSDVASLPTLAYEDDPDTTQVDKSTLRVLTEDGSVQLILFKSVEERMKAVAAILELQPHLRPEN